VSLKIEKVNFSYRDKKVLNDISFEVQKGRLACLLGANGVGKSTLFKNILKLLPDYQGEIRIDSVNTKKLGIKEMARLVAYIPQSHMPAFNFNVFDMVLMGTTIKTSPISKPGKKQQELVEQMLEKLGIAELKYRGFNQISGGERQLTLIARALVQEAKILLMDEPTANLDYGNQVKILNQMKALTEEGYTIIQSTHQPDQAFLYADEVVAMQNGCVLRQGSPREVIESDTIKQLYGIEVDIHSIYQDRMRVCIPTSVIARL